MEMEAYTARRWMLGSDPCMWLGTISGLWSASTMVVLLFMLCKSWQSSAAVERVLGSFTVCQCDRHNSNERTVSVNCWDSFTITCLFV